jgi:hypothetical protein
MCKEDAVEKLVSFNFAGFTKEVEEALSFNARNADPRIRPFYSRILYTWYISRGDYRNGTSCQVSCGVKRLIFFLAALVMYQRARKISSILGEPSNFPNLAGLQLEAYVVAMNALSLLDQKNAWIAVPVVAETGHEVSSCIRLLQFPLIPAYSYERDGGFPNTSQKINILLENVIWKSWRWLIYNTNTPFYPPD